MIDQIAIFAENRQGRLCSMMKLMKDNGINMRALNISDTTEFGIVRMIVDKPDKALEIFKENNYIASSAKVIAFAINDEVGAFYDVIKLLSEQNINLEYCYSLMGDTEKTAEIVIKTDETERAQKILEANGIRLI